MIDYFTILSAENAQLTKKFILKDDNKIHVDSYHNAKNFNVKKVSFNSFTEFIKILSSLGADPNSCIIRGTTDTQQTHVQRNKDVFFEESKRWVMLDLDKISINNQDDIFNDIQNKLPTPFKDVAYYWTFSSSHGIYDKNTYSIHLWFLLNKPMNEQQLKSAFNNTPFDKSTFRTVQIHYTSFPLIDKRIKLDFKRDGVCKGSSIEVDVPEEWLTVREPELISVPATSRKEFNANQAKKMDDFLANSSPEERHNSVGKYVINSYIAGASFEDIEAKAEAWMYDNGREPQKNEIYNWYMWADNKFKKGQLEILHRELFPEHDFNPISNGEIKKEVLTEDAIISQNEVIVRWEDALDRNQYGNIKPTRHNVIRILSCDERLKDVFGDNVFVNTTAVRKPLPWNVNEKIYSEGRAFNDDDALQTAVWISEKFGIEVSLNMIHEAVRKVALMNPYHPVRDYLDSLKWDKTPRLKHFFTGGIVDAKDEEVEDEYLENVAIKFFISAVARIYDPGCQADAMIVLEGSQGLGKSSLVAELGGKWYGDDIGTDIRDKDSVLSMMGKWIIELPEMYAHSKADTDHYKSFIGRRIDRIRAPYGRTIRDYPRQCVFIGTTNRDQYLKDETGARRIWPVNCKTINLKRLIEFKDELWAEAVYRYKNGESWFFDEKKLEALCHLQSSSRYIEDEWEWEVRHWIEDNDMEMFTGTDVWTQCFGKNAVDFSRREQGRIASILKRIGFKKQNIRVNGKVKKGYKKQ